MSSKLKVALHRTHGLVMLALGEAAHSGKALGGEGARQYSAGGQYIIHMAVSEQSNHVKMLLPIPPSCYFPGEVSCNEVPSYVLI